LARREVPTKLLCHSPSSAGLGEEKYDEELVRQDKDREITSYCHVQNKLDFGKLFLFIAN